MPITDIFSKRQKRLRGEFPDVYQYETIPEGLRYQILYIWADAYGSSNLKGGRLQVHQHISRVLCREYGIPSLAVGTNSYGSVRNFFLRIGRVERAIDVIELSFQQIDWYVRKYPNLFKSSMPPDEAIAELNHRFKEHGVGYQYESGQIIRVDSEFVHSEVVKPALSMLSDPMYEGANAEFLSAHDHYRAKRYDDCMNDCLKAFESCIIAICEARGWDYDNRDTIKPLIDIIFDNELIPNFMDSHFTGLRKAVDVRKGLRTALESGVPTLRNNLSGHGDGTEEVPVPEYIAAYTLHLTASNLLFLAKANEEME